MSTGLFTGIGVALVTLFHSDGSVDLESTSELAAQVVELGVQGLVVAGSSGEAVALDAAERVKLLLAVKKTVGGRVPVLAGTGAPTAHQAVELTKGARDAGADGLLVLPPINGSTIVEYYEEVASAADGLPILGYHFPGPHNQGIPLETLPKLPIDGCKDSSCDASRLLLTLASFEGALYTGSAAMLALAGPLGCAGAILALSNSHPELCVAAFGGDMDAQRKLAEPERRANSRFPLGVKELVAERFGYSTTSRIY